MSSTEVQLNLTKNDFPIYYILHNKANSDTYNKTFKEKIFDVKTVTRSSFNIYK